MGRFKAEAIIVKDMERLTIIFKDKETIWVLPKTMNINIIFNRWWTPLGSYTAGWQDFRRKLYRNKKLDVPTIYALARKHEIQSMGTIREPNLGDKKIKVIKVEGRRTK